ncbi:MULTISPECIES: Spo0E family sporulation regulatory protein-aspartic acid phosphatase [Shouchella]|uniref:Spo0E family sporulation regulatory protein-aspartic acid phosphatase n=2 Tax=Shouchella TaxID=2893057 RepID=A0ABY7W635_9BACI|nr:MULTISPECIES: Spo0E family sporulation regulatory protein-aspartic acid phosphatase [Shouchella]MED4130457.1 Spo0E family sporulation regulatory protein-aspartic acid phosphatase [Shouchella miscanthi]WDF04339.1 Spo0E family sporulation regulatory protein-aspartic acid phosphatase [Shouchella hunanensis]GAF24140.1 hypothetical protein JCM19047_4014 [Bacillus sp. JCM 19047]
MNVRNDLCLERLELLRYEMLQAAKRHGLNHPLVLTYSEQIDDIHNRLMRKDQSPLE